MDERDVADLAQLHVSCLSDSVVAALGPRYVRSFYRYVTRSDKEIAIVERNQAGGVVAAAVVSLEPASLNRRLLFHTSLLSSFVRNAPHMLALLLSPDNEPGDRRVPDRTRVSPATPEMILIYTAVDERGHGRGSALILEAERRLRELNVLEYQVRTVADPSNPTLAYYRNRGFAPSGTSFKLGRRFQVFTRTLDTTRAAP